jgi:hypothetical protein
MTFAMFDGDARVQMAQIVWRREGATKTHQTVVLTVVVLHARIGCVGGHRLE